MIRLPNLLLIGATGRNVGKTAYAVCLIRRLAAIGPVAAAKITVIRDGSVCPHGGTGCGSCSILDDVPYVLQQDDCTGEEDKKDTHLLRSAGAQPVWWLRVRQAHLATGLDALAQRLDPTVPVVAESNSARHGLEPGLFLMLRDGSGKMKPSCQTVLPYVDAMIERIGDEWDVGVERPRFAAGTWSLPEAIGAIILAGGASRRMGRNKALLPWDGRPLIAHIAAQLRRCTDDVVISTNDPTAYAFLAARMVPDRQPGAGPLMGLASCLASASHERNLLVGCDMPHIPLPTVRALLAHSDGYDAVVPRTIAGHAEPLFAIYNRRCLAAAEAALAEGHQRMTDLLDRVRVRWVDAADLRGNDWNCNLNTPEDYQAAISNNIPLS